LAKTGYIIHSNPIAIGNDTVSILKVSNTSLILGKAAPNPTPSTIARKIQSGKKRSRSESCLTTLTGLAWVEDDFISAVISRGLHRISKHFYT
jgi:hypothetical protein